MQTYKSLTFEHDTELSRFIYFAMAKLARISIANALRKINTDTTT